MANALGETRGALHDTHRRPGRMVGGLTNQPVRVLSVPSGHNYPLRLRAVAGAYGDSDSEAAVTHLPDPLVPGADHDQWWPPPALDTAWLRQHEGTLDVVHLHFGFDHQTPQGLQAWTTELRRQQVPLVLTVHDLVNPHFVDQREHLARLDALVPAASSVLTLTNGVARQITARWNVPVTVTPHPHVAPAHLIGAARDRPLSPWVVGLHLKGLRANIAARPMVTATVEAVGQLPDAVLRVDVNAEVWRPSHPRHDRALTRTLLELEAAGRLDLRVHETFTDDELFDYLRSIDVSLLPYAFGTHSGWVEACHDVGAAVVAPRTGFWVEQQPMSTFGWPVGGPPDLDELGDALRRTHRAAPQRGADRTDRVAEQARVSSFHDELYLNLVASSRSRMAS
ncbi:MAG: glycosyltransferase family 1 protein [Humibacillus sp.]|nr:glycosyltransferase family 1 protein [Humibacillus sp.]MDN5775712.1 glycosyltransferase family 1 protein [Humibacillus sp.]